MLPRVFFLIASIIALTAFSPITAGSPRLGNNVLPLSYDLSVVANLKTMQTSGEETIEIHVTKLTDTIVLNWMGLTVSGATLDSQPVATDLHSELQQLWLRPSVPVLPGKHALHLIFRSRIQDFFDARGFWDDALPTPTNPQMFLVTMFEPSTARMMFPCFDEPGFRASFTVHVTAPAGWTVVSNMPVKTRTLLDPASARTDFAPTPGMPTYLLTIDAAVMISNAGESDGIPIRVYGAPQTKDLQLILPRAQRILHYYNSYLGVRYPLPKLDIITAPGRENTALEQWGAMTFYQAKDITSGGFSEPAASERRAFEELAHEMGHQWFGDLVGMQWWRDTFVAEGLTQWLTTKADSALEPNWPWYRENDADVDAVMQPGVNSKSRPVITTISTDYERDDWIAFSSATYHKSAALLNFWEAYIGKHRFREALQRYLRRYTGTAVTFEQFWGSFNDPMARRYGDAWLKRPGFPVITVASRCKDGRQTVRFTQAPFLNGHGAPAGYTRQIWPVPILMSVGEGVARAYLMQRRSQDLTAGTCGEKIAIDSGLRPYYRIRYAHGAQTAARLATASERDRNNAVMDAAALYDAGVAPADYFLNFASLLKPTDPFTLFRSVTARYSVLLAALAPGAEHDAVAASIRTIFGPFIQRVPEVNGNAQPQPYTSALYTLSQAGYPAFAAEAQAQLDTLLIKQSTMAWVFAPPLAAMAAADADQQHVNAMEALFEKNSKQSLSPQDVLEGASFAYLVNVGSSALAQQILTRYSSDSTVVFALARRHPMLVWRFLQSHTREVLSRIPPSQQPSVLAREVAQTFWFLPPTEVRGYLERKLGRYNRFTIRFAMTKIAEQRSISTTTTSQVHRWMKQTACGSQLAEKPYALVHR